MDATPEQIDLSRRLPLALRIVATLFVINGIWAVIEVCISFLNHGLSINLNVLDIFVGLGLLRLSLGWRTCGLVFLWIGMIATPVVTAVIFKFSGDLEWTLLGQRLGEAPVAPMLALLWGWFALHVWQYRVLTRPAIRELFGVEPA